MALTLPAAVPSMGTRRVYFIPAAVDIEAITVAEITAGDNLSCYLTRDGWAPTKDQATITDSRYCSAQDFEIPGAKTRSLMLTYTTNLNEAGDDEARLALEEGTEGILVHLLQVDADHDTPESGDFYEAVPVRAGEQNILPVEDNALDRIQQKAFITGEWTSFHQIAA